MKGYENEALARRTPFIKTEAEPTFPAPPLPTYDQALAALDGCSAQLSRLMDAVRELFATAGSDPGRERYERAIDELKAAHDAAVDWVREEVKRYA